MVRELFLNFSVLVTLTFLLSYHTDVQLGPEQGWRSRTKGWLFLTACGVILMEFPYRSSTGVLVDFRAVLPALAGFTGGYAAGLPVAVALGAYRLLLGGPGAVAGMLLIVCTGVASGLLGTGHDALTQPWRKLAVRSLLVFLIGCLPVGLVPGQGASLLVRLYPLMVPLYTAGFLVCLSIFRLRHQVERNLRETHHMAYTDALTGLHNLRGFSAIMEESVEAGDAYLLMFDVDHFKAVNDCHGHEYGNEVLRSIARVLREQTRSHDYAFRYGGEEFAVLLRNCYYQQAVQVAERLRRTVQEYPFVSPEGRRLHVTISGGIIRLQPGLRPGDQVAEADALLYRAKEAGRNRIEAVGGTVTPADQAGRYVS
jgi:diguanylate cyclase